MAIRYQQPKPVVILNNRRRQRTTDPMKQMLYSLAVAMSFALGASQAGAADCYADYKAKQDKPLRLHYGVVQLSGDCSMGAAKSEISDRLAGSGWKLLNVLSVFGPEGLSEREDSAGPFYLRY
jgi:hypothetical protein